MTAGLINNGGEARESFYALHPCTIDFAFQLFSVTVFKGLSRLFTQLSVPTYIGELTIRPTSEEISVEVNVEVSPKGLIFGDAVGTTSSGTAFQLKRLKLSPLTDAEKIRGNDPHAALELVWQPDIRFVDNSTLMREEKDVGALSMLVERMALACAIESSILFKDLEPCQPFLSMFREFVDKQANAALEANYPNVSDCKDIALMTSTERRGLIEEIYQKATSTDACDIATAVHRVFHSAKQIFLGGVDPVDILMRDGLLATSL